MTQNDTGMDSKTALTELDPEEARGGSLTVAAGAAEETARGSETTTDGKVGDNYMALENIEYSLIITNTGTPRIASIEWIESYLNISRDKALKIIRTLPFEIIRSNNENEIIELILQITQIGMQYIIEDNFHQQYRYDHKKNTIVLNTIALDGKRVIENYYSPQFVDKASPTPPASRTPPTSQTPPMPTCPRCGSPYITTGPRGVDWFWGLFGATKTVNRCSNCGLMWEPKIKK